MDFFDYIGNSSFTAILERVEGTREKQIRILFRKHNSEQAKSQNRRKGLAGITTDRKSNVENNGNNEVVLSKQTRLQVDRMLALIKQTRKDAKKTILESTAIEPKWANSKKLLKSISNLTALYIVTMRLVDYIFTLLPTRKAKEKTFRKHFWQLNEFCTNLFDNIVGETNHWKLLDKLCRIFEHGNPTKEPGHSKYNDQVNLRERLFHTIIQNPKQAHAFVNLPAQEFSPDKYRDNILDELKREVRRTTVVRWRRCQVSKRHISVYRLYLFNKAYKVGSTEMPVLIRSPTQWEVCQERERDGGIHNRVREYARSARRNKPLGRYKIEVSRSESTQESFSNDDQSSPPCEAAAIPTDHRHYPVNVSVVTDEDFRKSPYAEELLVLDFSPHSSVKLIQYSTVDIIYLKNFDNISRYLSTKNTESYHLQLDRNSVLWIPRECDEIGIDVSVIRGRNNAAASDCVSAISNETFGMWLSFLIDNGRSSTSPGTDIPYNLHYSLGVGQTYEIRNSHKKPWSCILDKPRGFCGITKLENYDYVHTGGCNLIKSLQLISNVLQMFHDEQISPTASTDYHEFSNELRHLLQVKDFAFTTVKISFTTFDKHLNPILQKRKSTRTKPRDSNASVTLSLILLYNVRECNARYGLLSFTAYMNPCIQKFISREKEYSVMKSRLMEFRKKIETIYNEIFSVDRTNPNAALAAPVFSYLYNIQGWSENGTITMRSSYCRELWCSAGVDVIRRIMETVSSRDAVLQALLVLLYLDKFQAFSEGGNHLLQKHPNIDVPPAFVLVSAMEGSFRDWFIVTYSSTKTLGNAIHAIGVFLSDIDSHIALDVFTFRQMVQTLIEHLPKIDETRGQRLSFYAALVGLLPYNPQNGFLAYPAEDGATLLQWDFQMNISRTLHPLSKGITSFRKLARLILQYCGMIDHPECNDFRLYRAYDVMLEILQCSPQYNTVFRHGQPLYFVVWNEHCRTFIPSRRAFNSKDWIPLPTVCLNV